jgi:DNA-binding transcriptional LysR family regulator
MDIHQLRVFTSVFKNKSFSRASEELHLTQPTISNHIKALEDEFGCKLFDRLGRTIIPTREAEILFNHSMELIEKASAIKEAIGEIRKDLTGKLIVGASTIPGVYLILPPVITKKFLVPYIKALSFFVSWKYFLFPILYSIRLKVPIFFTGILIFFYPSLKD